MILTEIDTMAINTTALMALEGNFVVGVKTGAKFTLVDLVRIKKAITNGYYDKSYDMNDDGVLDSTDIELLKKIVLQNLFKTPY